ncbi:IS3 family transposase [Bacillus sp. SB49]|uniref:IS3 family transposase n=1 Tax=Bacillus sp. SB49 TaxID=1071080 RepID=UPI00138AFD8F|nr:IS3 family transposase [Bacillus sp. SB49]QHT47953.1 IS3 family transposase [Bacillus sp. SB49]
MNKWSKEEKLSIVLRYQNENISIRGLSEELDIDNSSLRYWVKLFQYHGNQAFHFPYTNYPPAFKLKVINYIQETGASIREASALFHIPDFSMVRRWIVKWKQGGLAALGPAQEDQLLMAKDKSNKPSRSFKSIEEEIEYLRMENAYLKKLNALVEEEQEPTERQKAQTVFELRHAFPVYKLVKVAGIPRSTYYYHVKQMGKTDPDRELKEKITEIFHQSDRKYGYRRVQNQLENEGIHVNHKKVYRLMKELGLRCQVRMKKYHSYKGKVGEVADNLLNREFTASKPNQKWVTDITEFKLFGEKLYLSPILDLFNGEIITYTIGLRPTYALVAEMLENGLQRLNPKDELMMHSDQGWHYQMRPYRERLQEAGITQSMSRKGNCHDNAVIENFFGIMKSELLYYKEFESIEHFKEQLTAFMDNYNHQRIKSKLRMSPIQFREKFNKAS